MGRENVNRRLQLTRGRLITLIIGVPITLIVIAVSAVNVVSLAGQGSYPVHLDIPVRGHAVRLTLDSGSLHVRQAPSRRLRLTGTAGYSLVPSKVTWHLAASGVTVDSSCNSFVVSHVCNFNYLVMMPSNVSETFSDSSGDITVSGVTNTVVTASDSSGNITLIFTKVPDRVTVSDSFGDVSVVLPAGSTAYKVNAHSSFGNTLISVPTSSSSAHVITVTNSSGSISISN